MRSRLLKKAAVLAGSGSLIWFFLHALFQPFYCGFNLNSVELSGLRLANSFGLLHGLKYPSLENGVFLTPIYGPVGFCAYWPAVLFSLPSNAMLAAQIIAAICFFGPVLWIFVGKNLPHSRLDGVLAFLVFGLLACTASVLKVCGFLIHVDAPALGLAALAAGLLYTGTHSDKRLMLSALCTALSVWTKQTMLPLAAALILYVWVARGKKAGIRYSVFFAISFVVVTAAIICIFDVRDLWLNMVLVPFNHPWAFPDSPRSSPDRWTAGLMVLRQLSGVIAIPCALLLLGLWRDHCAGSFKGGLSAWLSSNTWFVFTLVGIFLLPSSFLGTVKIGAGSNNLGLSYYFLLISALLALIRKRTADMLLLYVLLALTVSQNWTILEQNPIARNEKRFVMDTAWRFALKHPGEAYFPGMPLASFMAEKELYHSFIGLWERKAAGLKILPSHFREGLPARLKWIIFGPPDWYTPYDKKILGGFPNAKITTLSELPGWVTLAVNDERADHYG